MPKPFRAKAAFAAVFLSAAVLFSSASVPAFERRQGTVARVVDGDTVKMTNGDKIRLIGINTPEYEPWKNYAQYYGREAAAYSKKLLTGKNVLLEADTEARDKYGRRLAYVFLEDGTFVNERLVEEGYAEARYYAPNGRYRETFNAAQRRAKAAKKGIWSSEIPFRKRSILDNSTARD